MLLDFMLNNLRITLASIIIILGIIFSIVSLFENKREQTTKMAGTCFSISITLFANHFWVYFATVFIIATLITDSTFLQNLAAIIRGNESYFKSQRPQKYDEKKQEIEQDIKMVNYIKNNSIETKKVSPHLQNKISIESYFLVENYVFDHLEKDFNSPIQRNVIVEDKGKINRFRGLDGLLKQGIVDILFEVKLAPTNESLEKLKNKYITNAKEILEDYKQITNRTASLRFILVGNIDSKTKMDFYNALNNSYGPNSKLDIIAKFISFDDIGLKFEDGTIVPNN